MNNIQTCNIKSCKNYIENSYKKCLKHRLLNRKSQQKARGGGDCDSCDVKSTTTRSITTKMLKKKIYDKIQKYYSTDKKKGLSLENYITVDIVYNLIQKTSNCIYCNDKILYNYMRNDKKQFSVDRIDSSLSHCVGNIQIICLTCNVSKGSKSHNEFLQYIQQKNNCISL